MPNAVDSAIKGDFKEDDGSYSDKVGKIIGGLNPAGDIRDIIANTKNVAEGKKGSSVALGASIIGAIPGGGDVAKPIIKEVGEELAEKAVKEISTEATEKLAKEEAERIAREAIEKQYDEIAQSGHAVQRHGESIIEQQLDDRAMRGIDPASGTTNDAYKVYPDGTPKPHMYSKDATKFTSKEALVKAYDSIITSKSYSESLVDAEAKNLERFSVEGIKLEDIYGANYKDQVFGKTRVGSRNNPTGTIETDFTDGSVIAVFQKEANGKWILYTMFPEPKI